MRPRITCTSEGIYPLTRGQQYEQLAHNAEEGLVRVRTDNGRSHWLSASHFDLSGGTVPLLVAWCFDDPVIDPQSGRDETDNWVDISLKFDDGTRRWCQMMTPDYLKGLLEQSPTQPMLYSKHLIMVRDLAITTVEQVLIYLDRQGELIEFSLPL